MEVGLHVGFGPSSVQYVYRGSVLAQNTSWYRVNTSTNYSCNKLLDDANLKDGKIPAVLGISFAVLFVLFCVFLIIRYFASDYSRVGVISTGRWGRALYVRKGSTLFKDEDTPRVVPTTPETEHYWFSWIVSYFKLSSRDIKLRCGPDAIVYLALERYLIVLLCVFTVLSLLIILPINYLAGDLQSAGFPKTTISNISSSSAVLWVHTIFSLLYLLITVVFMIRFSLVLGKTQQENSTHTVMVQWIPKYVHREDLMQHFQEALSESQVADIQLAYDVSDLTKFTQKLMIVDIELESVESVENELGVQERIRVGWNRLCFCSEDCKVNAHEYYEGLHTALDDAITKEKLSIRNKRLNIGFITFNRQKDAANFYTSYKIFHVHPKSTMYDTIRARWWWVSMAPFPLDIIWENLSVSYIKWWIRWLLINLVLVAFLFFFTTPPIILSSVDSIKVWLLNATKIPDLSSSIQVNPLVRVFISNLLLLFFAFLMPFCVSRSSYLEAHWTKSTREQTIMRKTYIFLVLMVIFLPSLGLASLNALGELAHRGGEAVNERLQCVFLPNNGAFFIGYIIITALIGNAVELLRVPELAMYIYRRMKSKTRLQREHALKKAAQYDFMYGIQYAWNLVIFSMVMSFSLTTPLIVPFGVLYFILKYLVDKYNIYYIYQPASFNGRQFLHRSALNFVIVGAVHLQLSTLFFSVVRLGKVDPRTVVMIVALTLTVAACVAVMGFGWFSHLLPKLKLRMGQEHQIFSSTRGGGESMEETVIKGAYIPSVLKDLPVELPTDNSVNGYQSFGSTDRMGRTSPGSSPKITSGSQSSVTDLQTPTSDSETRRSSLNGAEVTPIPEEDECELDNEKTKLLS